MKTNHPISSSTSSEVAATAFGLGANVSPDQLKKMRRRDLENLLTTYADEADIFAEENQNAVDSVKTAHAAGRYNDGTKPRIDIFIGRRSGDTHYYAVYDNGLGMEPEIARNFTTPGFSAAKAKGKTVGYKGVGASFFVAASEKFAVWTRGESEELTEYTITGSHSWITNESEPEPGVAGEAALPKWVREAVGSGRGTAVCYYFHSSIKPSTLSHLVITDKDPSTEVGRWAAYLCAKTALGNLVPDEDIGLEVHFHLDTGNGKPHSEVWTPGTFSLQDRKLGYPYPQHVLKIARDTREIEALSLPKRDALQKTLQAVTRRWSAEEIVNDLETFPFKTEEQKNLVLDHFQFLDVFYAYSSSVLKELPERLGTRSALIRHGIKVGVDNVPQGRMLEFSFTSNIGLERQMHAVLSFDGLQLDLGRKIPSDETVNEVARILTNRAQSYLKDFRIFLKKEAKAAGGPAADLQDWRNQVIERGEKSLVGRMFDYKNVLPALTVDPENENDTIALFAGMMSLNLLKGLQLKALSGINQYDGLIDIDTISASLHSIDDPLAIRTKNEQRSGKLRVLEFKHNFDDLIRDFQEHIKNPQDIDLVIVWTIDQLNPPRGTIDYCFAEREGYREVYGATHVWRDDNGATDIPIISLQHAVTILLAQSENKAGEPGIGVAELRALSEYAKDAAI